MSPSVTNLEPQAAPSCGCRLPGLAGEGVKGASKPHGKQARKHEVASLNNNYYYLTIPEVELNVSAGRVRTDLEPPKTELLGYAAVGGIWLYK